MATYVHHIKTHNSETPTGGGPRKVLATNIIDFGDAKGNGAAGIYGATETTKAIRMPAGSILLSCGAFPMKAEGAACTIDLQTSGAETADVTALINDLDINALVGAEAAIAKQAQARFIAEGSIDVLINTASTDTAIICVWAEYLWLMDPRMTTATASL